MKADMGHFRGYIEAAGLQDQACVMDVFGLGRVVRRWV